MFEELHEDLMHMNSYDSLPSCDSFWCDEPLFNDLSLPNDAVGDSDDSGVSERMTNGLLFSPPSESEFFCERTDGQNLPHFAQSDSPFLSSCTPDLYPTNVASNGAPSVEDQPCRSVLSHQVPADAYAQSTIIPSTFLVLPRDALIVPGLPSISTNPPIGASTKMPKYVALAPNSVQAVEPNADKLSRLGGATKAKMLKSEKQIRNRESARSFRERKKQHYVYMEWKVNELQAENNMLKRENVALKNEISRLLIRVENMQNEYQYCDQSTLVKQTKNPKKRKNAAMLAVVLMLFTVNFGPLSLPRSQTQSPRFSRLHNDPSYPDIDHRLNRIRRSRLTNFPSFSKVWDKVDTVRPFSKVRVTSERPCDTYRYVNNTETLRLTDELNRWAQRHKRNWNIILREPGHVGAGVRHGAKNSKNRGKLVKSVFGSYASHRGPPTLESFKKKSSLRADDPNRMNSTGIDRFFSSLQWRNDTFYVVSILKDYLILPATAYNRTGRPRMSLIMPAIPYNDTLPMSFEGLAMLQIECEVMNTKLLRLSGRRNPVNSSRLNPRSDNITKQTDDRF